MKLSGWLLRVSLIVAIALSLVFTWFIWQNPSRLGRSEATVAVKHQADPNAKKLEGEVFSPSTAYYQTNGQKYQLNVPDKMITSQLRTAMKTWRLGKVDAGIKFTATDYNNLLVTNDSLQLLYPATMTYKKFNQTYFKKSAKTTNADFKFTRLLIALNAKKTTLTFINDANRTVREAKLTNVSLGDLTQTIRTGLKNAYKISEMRIGTKQIESYDQEIEVQPYVYLLDQQSANHYVSLLMPSQEASAVDTREIGTETVYTAGANYRLTLDTETDTMQFDNAAATSTSTNLDTILNRSYTALGNLSLQGLNYMRYAGYDKSAQEITFRSYAQGLPIYNTDYFGRVTVASTVSGLQMVFSSNNLTVPIPTKQAKVKLTTTAALLAKFKTAGYAESTIQDIRLGYYWGKQSDNTQVVTLTPTYFVKINNEYKRASQWLETDADVAKAGSSSAASTTSSTHPE